MNEFQPTIDLFTNLIPVIIFVPILVSICVLVVAINNSTATSSGIGCSACVTLSLDGNAGVGDVLLGQTFYSNSTTKLTGTLSLLELHSGQTTSYDTGDLDDGAQDGTVKSYTDNGDNTVTDNHTGLMWQKVGSSTMTWENALSFCDSNTDGGYTDWILPSAVELITLSDYSYPSSRYLNSVFIPQAGTPPHWSSTTLPHSSTEAYSLSIASGSIQSGGKTFSDIMIARCVRPS